MASLPLTCSSPCTCGFSHMGTAPGLFPWHLRLVHPDLGLLLPRPQALSTMTREQGLVAPSTWLSWLPWLPVTPQGLASLSSCRLSPLAWAGFPQSQIPRMPNQGNPSSHVPVCCLS